MKFNIRVVLIKLKNSHFENKQKLGMIIYGCV